MEICLKMWQPEDRQELVRLCSNVDRSYLSDRLPDPYTPEDADSWLSMARDKEGQDGIFRAITVDGVPVGNITVERRAGVGRKDAEIGYLLMKDSWSKGIMTQAVEEICRIAFNELDVARISGDVYSLNTASRRVLEKNGFVLEGIRKNALFRYGVLHDECMYGKYRIE